MRALPVGVHPGPSGRPHAELFAIWFDGVGHRHVAVREAFDLGDCDAAPTGLRVRMGGSTLDTDGAIGSARSGAHTIGWRSCAAPSRSMASPTPSTSGWAA